MLGVAEMVPVGDIVPSPTVMFDHGPQLLPSFVPSLIVPVLVGDVLSAHARMDCSPEAGNAYEKV